MQQIPTHINLNAIVKDIFESDDVNAQHKIPFYADGSPGIIYSSEINAKTSKKYSR